MLKSMVVSDMEKKESSILSHVEDKPNYPYGLKITLDADTIEKLGLSDLPEVGSKVQIVAVAEVVNVRKDSEYGDVAKHSIELQIQDMEASPESVEKKASSVLYGGDY